MQEKLPICQIVFNLGCIARFTDVMLDVVKTKHKDVYLRFASLALVYGAVSRCVHKILTILMGSSPDAQIVKTYAEKWMVFWILQRPTRCRDKLSNFLMGESISELEKYLMENHRNQKDDQWSLHPEQTLHPQVAGEVLLALKSIAGKISSKEHCFYAQFSNMISHSLMVGHSKKNVSGAWCCVQKHTVGKLFESSSQCMRRYYRSSRWFAYAFNLVFVAALSFLFINWQWMVTHWHILGLMCYVSVLYALLFPFVRINRSLAEHVKYENYFNQSKLDFKDIRENLLYHGSLILALMHQRCDLLSDEQRQMLEILYQGHQGFSSKSIDHEWVNTYCGYIFSMLEFHIDIDHDAYLIQEMGHWEKEVLHCVRKTAGHYYELNLSTAI